MNDPNRRLTPDGNGEQFFRQHVRELLDLDWSTRDAKIFAELRRLKEIERRVELLEAKVTA